MNPPSTPGPSGSQGVSQLRFLNDYQGWAFGPALFVTENSGAQWAPESTFGRVMDLEALDGRVLALEAKGCTGAGANFAAGCTSFTLYTAPAEGGTWQPVPGAANIPSVPSSDSANLVLTGGNTNPADATGYLLTPDGSLLSGALNAGARWKNIATAGCQPGAARADGQPSGALLAASSGKLYVACITGSQSTLYVLPAGASRFQPLGSASALGKTLSLAAASGNLVVLGTSKSIDVSYDGGTAWRQAVTPAQAPAGGFGYVGMTNQQQGVALPADSHLGQIWTTTDGGIRWRPYRISG
jgi:hypothetical protein